MTDETKNSVALHLSSTSLTPTTSSIDSNSSNLLSQQTKNLTNILPNGKKTKGRVKIKMEYIENKLRRYTTFSKRKTGIMKKAHELSILTGTQVMLLVASETGHVYAFSTNKLKPMISSEQGKNLIQTCLNSPDEQCIDINSTIKTEFTFEPSNNGCLTPTNPRKRKFIDGDGSSLPTMVISNVENDLISNSFVVDEFFSNESDDSYEMENDDDDDEDNDDENEESVNFPQTSFNSSTIVNKNINTKIENADNNSRKSNNNTLKLKTNNITNNVKQTTNSKPIKWTTSSPQTMLKDALKAAADQRKRQKKLTSNSLNAYSNNHTLIGNNSSNNNNNNNNNLLQQQLNALLPIMLQGSNFNINQSTNSTAIVNSNKVFETNSNFLNKNNSISDNNNSNNIINDIKNYSNNTNTLQQLLNGGFSFENLSAFQQVLATAALSQLAENLKS